MSPPGEPMDKAGRVCHPGTGIQVRRMRGRLLLFNTSSGLPLSQVYRYLKITGINCSLIWCFGRLSRSWLPCMVSLRRGSASGALRKLSTCRERSPGAGSLRSLRVNLFGVETPFVESAEVNRAGEFRFHSLVPGNYTCGRPSQRPGRSSAYGSGQRRSRRSLPEWCTPTIPYTVI